ncbi:MAG: type II toxin-antitoxin system RelE/ParE family toxin [Anaerolineae bacterium]|nr:type II toxin-antitoxin system RelE/ParE family toxin [Anaerolineae bacterium]
MVALSGGVAGYYRPHLGQFLVRGQTEHGRQITDVTTCRRLAGCVAGIIFYFAHTGQRFVLLHAFQKKTRKTPHKELAIAQRRLTDVLARVEEE